MFIFKGEGEVPSCILWHRKGKPSEGGIHSRWCGEHTLIYRGGVPSAGRGNPLHGGESTKLGYIGAAPCPPSPTPPQSETLPRHISKADILKGCSSGLQRLTFKHLYTLILFHIMFRYKTFSLRVIKKQLPQKLHKFYVGTKSTKQCKKYGKSCKICQF